MRMGRRLRIAPGSDPSITPNTHVAMTGLANDAYVCAQEPWRFQDGLTPLRRLAFALIENAVTALHGRDDRARAEVFAWIEGGRALMPFELVAALVSLPRHEIHPEALARVILAMPRRHGRRPPIIVGCRIGSASAATKPSVSLVQA